MRILSDSFLADSFVSDISFLSFAISASSSFSCRSSSSADVLLLLCLQRLLVPSLHHSSASWQQILQAAFRYPSLSSQHSFDGLLTRSPACCFCLFSILSGIVDRLLLLCLSPSALAFFSGSLLSSFFSASFTLLSSSALRLAFSSAFFLASSSAFFLASSSAFFLLLFSLLLGCLLQTILVYIGQVLLPTAMWHSRHHHHQMHQ